MMDREEELNLAYGIKSTTEVFNQPSQVFSSKADKKRKFEEATIEIEKLTESSAAYRKRSGRRPKNEGNSEQFEFLSRIGNQQKAMMQHFQSLYFSGALAKSTRLLANNAILRFLMHYNLPLSVVEDPSFHVMLQTLSGTDDTFLPFANPHNDTPPEKENPSENVERLSHNLSPKMSHQSEVEQSKLSSKITAIEPIYLQPLSSTHSNGSNHENSHPFSSLFSPQSILSASELMSTFEDDIMRNEFLAASSLESIEYEIPGIFLNYQSNNQNQQKSNSKKANLKILYLMCRIHRYFTDKRIRLTRP